MKVIYLNFIQKIDYNCIKSIGEFIKSNKNIEEMSLMNSKISDSDIEILAPYFDGNTSFRRLFINSNKDITDKSIPFLVKAVESSHIVEIGIFNTSIVDMNIIHISLACNAIKIGFNALNVIGK